MAGADEGSRIRDVVRDSKIRWDIPSKPYQKFDSFTSEANRDFGGLRHHLKHDYYSQIGRDFPRTIAGGVGEGSLQCCNSLNEYNYRWIRKELPLFHCTSHIEDFYDWVDAIEVYFDKNNLPENLKCTLVSYTLEGEDEIWWQQLQLNRMKKCKAKISSWSRMKALLFKYFMHTTCLIKCLSEVDNRNKVMNYGYNIPSGRVQLIDEQERKGECEFAAVAHNNNDEIAMAKIDGFTPNKCSTRVFFQSYNDKQEERNDGNISKEDESSRGRAEKFRPSMSLTKCLNPLNNQLEKKEEMKHLMAADFAHSKCSMKGTFQISNNGQKQIEGCDSKDEFNHLSSMSAGTCKIFACEDVPSDPLKPDVAIDEKETPVDNEASALLGVTNLDMKKTLPNVVFGSMSDSNDIGERKDKVLFELLPLNMTLITPREVVLEVFQARLKGHIPQNSPIPTSKHDIITAQLNAKAKSADSYVQEFEYTFCFASHKTQKVKLLVQSAVETSFLFSYNKNSICLTCGGYIDSTYLITDFASIMFDPGGIFYPVRTRGTISRIEILAELVSLSDVQTVQRNRKLNRLVLNEVLESHVAKFKVRMQQELGNAIRRAEMLIDYVVATLESNVTHATVDRTIAESLLSRPDHVSWKMALARRQQPLLVVIGFIDVDKINLDTWPTDVADLASEEHGSLIACGYTRMSGLDKEITKDQTAIALAIGNARVDLVEREANATCEKELQLEREKVCAIEELMMMLSFNFDPGGASSTPAMDFLRHDFSVVTVDVFGCMIIRMAAEKWIVVGHCVVIKKENAVNKEEGKCWAVKVMYDEGLIEAIDATTTTEKDSVCFVEAIVHKNDTSKEFLEPNLVVTKIFCDFSETPRSGVTKEIPVMMRVRFPLGSILTRGREIPWKGWNDENIPDIEEKIILTMLSNVKSMQHVNVWKKSASHSSIFEEDGGDIKFVVDDEVEFYVVFFVKDAVVDYVLMNSLKGCGAGIHVIVKIGSADGTVKLFHNVVNGLDPPMNLDNACEADKIDLPGTHPVSKTFNVVDLIPYHSPDDAQTEEIQLEDEFVFWGADGDDAVRINEGFKRRVIFVYLYYLCNRGILVF